MSGACARPQTPEVPTAHAGNHCCLSLTIPRYVNVTVGAREVEWISAFLHGDHPEWDRPARFHSRSVALWLSTGGLSSAVRRKVSRASRFWNPPADWHTFRPLFKLQLLTETCLHGNKRIGRINVAWRNHARFDGRKQSIWFLELNFVCKIQEFCLLPPRRALSKRHVTLI